MSLLLLRNSAAVCVCVWGGTYLVHSSRDWTSICWKVQISSRFPRISATSEQLSLKHTRSEAL